MRLSLLMGEPRESRTLADGGELIAKPRLVALVATTPAAVDTVRVQPPEHPPALDLAAAAVLARIIRHARDRARQDGARGGDGG